METTSHLTPIGYTTGVFDMFHVGHLNIIRRAAAACDRLVVGVTTDELAMERKGRAPIIPFDERVEIVRACRHVDEVVAQTDMDKLKAWEEVGFDVMFVGSDWKGSKQWIEWEREFGARGVAITYFPYTVHTSSTMLRQVIEDRIAEQALTGGRG